MLKHIAATVIAFSFVGSAAAAEGFQPWAGRAADSSYTITASSKDSGFRPWDGRDIQVDVFDVKAQKMITDAGFRPWASKAS